MRRLRDGEKWQCQWLLGFTGVPELGLTEVGEERLTRGEELTKEMVVVRG